MKDTLIDIKDVVSGSLKTTAGKLIASAILLIFLVPFIFALPVMWLWNWIMPDIFGLVTIGYWKAFGIMALCGILFKGGKS